MRVDLALLFLGLLVFSAHLFSALYDKRKIPDVLMLLFVGLLLGPVFNIVTPSDLGAVGNVFATITLVIILFEGGTSLKINVLKMAWKSTVNLTFSSFFMSVLVSAGIGMFFGMTLIESLILGSILGGTSSAVVIPLVRQLKMGDTPKTVLILESAATDVLCIVFTLGFLGSIKQSDVQVGNIVGGVISSFILAGVIGFFAALLWSRLIRRIRVVQNSIFTTPAFVFIVYGVTDLLGFSGAIAALVFGITMSNISTLNALIFRKIMGGRGVELNKTEMIFFGEIVFLLKTTFFVYIGISILFNDWLALLIGLIITVALLIGRIIITRYFAPEGANVFDKTIVATMIPKGLAAAVLANIPLAYGVAQGELIRNIVYAVILFSILMVSVLIIAMDKSRKFQNVFSLIFGGADPLHEDERTVFKTVERVTKTIGEAIEEIESKLKLSHPVQEGEKTMEVSPTTKGEEIDEKTLKIAHESQVVNLDAKTEIGDIEHVVKEKYNKTTGDTIEGIERAKDEE